MMDCFQNSHCVLLDELLASFGTHKRPLISTLLFLLAAISSMLHLLVADVTACSLNMHPCQHKLVPHLFKSSPIQVKRSPASMKSMPVVWQHVLGASATAKCWNTYAQYHCLQHPKQYQQLAMQPTCCSVHGIFSNLAWISDCTSATKNFALSLQRRLMT